MSHGSGLYIPPYVLRGARQVIPESGAFEPEEFLDLSGHHPGCSAFLAPTMVARLVQTGRACPHNLRTVVYGGGPMYVDSLKKAMAAFGPIFVQLYGQGEAPMTITGLRRADHLDADDAILGSVGYARSGMDVAVLRDDGSPAAIGEIGEIVCRGDVVMSGYWNNPEATAATLQNGWLGTGDMGSFDDRGYLTHVLGARPVGPGLLTRHRAGVAADAFVEVHHHRHLRHDSHQYVTSWERRRTIVTSSRWFPVGPR
jgi:acyl-CoA synthetase (AMP-forming)/AMP-acid ligase II